MVDADLAVLGISSVNENPNEKTLPDNAYIRQNVGVMVD
jgi:hypothetical protein